MGHGDLLFGHHFVDEVSMSGTYLKIEFCHRTQVPTEQAAKAENSGDELADRVVQRLFRFRSREIRDDACRIFQGDRRLVRR